MILFLFAAFAVAIAASLGFFAAAILAAGHHDDECRRCRRESLDAARWNTEHESYGGTDE